MNVSSFVAAGRCRRSSDSRLFRPAVGRPRVVPMPPGPISTILLDPVGVSSASRSAHAPP